MKVDLADLRCQLRCGRNAQTVRFEHLGGGKGAERERTELGYAFVFGRSNQADRCVQEKA